MSRRYAVFLLRLVVAAVAVGALVQLARPALCTLIARTARDVVLLTSWMPHLAELSWNGDRFQSGTSLAAGRITIEASLFLFTVGLPAAFAAALPGFGTTPWWRRLFGVVLLSVAASAVMLAIVVDARAAQEVSRLGLQVNPLWRDLAVRAMMLRSWDVGALLYPFAVCAFLAWVTFLRPPPRPSPLVTKRRLRVTLIAAPLVLTGLAAADWLAERRMQVSAQELYTRVVAENPGRGPLVLRRALWHETSGQHKKALHAYGLAAAYPRNRPQAMRGIQRMQEQADTR